MGRNVSADRNNVKRMRLYNGLVSGSCGFTYLMYVVFSVCSSSMNKGGNENDGNGDEQGEQGEDETRSLVQRSPDHGCKECGQCLSSHAERFRRSLRESFIVEMMSW